MNHETRDSTQKKQKGLVRSKRAKQLSKRALKELLLESSSNGQPEFIMEGGGNAGKNKPQTSDTNEVDRIEVVKDLGFSSTMTSLVFLYIFLIAILVNVDHGAIPAAISDIQGELGMDETEMGVIGSMVFFGLFLGSITASFIMDIFQHRTIICMSLVINGTSLWLLTMKSNLYLMCISRLITGFSQIFITIYVPVFLDAYSTPKSKSFMLSWILVMAPIGVVVGYAMTTYIILNDGLWEYPGGHYWFQSFRLQSFISWGFAAITMFIPRKYINITECVKLKRQLIEKKKKEYQKNSITTLQVQNEAQNDWHGDNSAQMQNYLVSHEYERATVFDEEDSCPIESPARIPKEKHESSPRELSSKESFYLLMKNKSYINLTLAITTLFFVISGVQMWATHYFEHAMHIDPKQASMIFGATALTSPVAGAFVSGYIINGFGGFYAPIALPFCIIIGVFGILSACLVPLTSDLTMTIAYLWILLFIGAIVLPIITGVMLTKVTPEMRPRANSISNISYMLLGYFPSPAVYGLAVQLHGKSDSGWGMGALMYASTFMPLFVILGAWYDPNITLSNMFKTLSNNKPTEIVIENVEPQNENEREIQSNSESQDLQQSGQLTVNIGLDVTGTFAKNDILESSEYQYQSYQESTEAFYSFDHRDESSRIYASSIQRQPRKQDDGNMSYDMLDNQYNKQNANTKIELAESFTLEFER